VSNPHQVTIDFERALCEYTGAPYAVSVNSCTIALLLAVAWNLRNDPHCDCGDLSDLMPGVMRKDIEIPKRTYVSVPMSIIHAGGKPVFRDEDWIGWYQLKPLPVFDSARWFTKDIYPNITLASKVIGAMVCVSFHASKTLGLEQGGAILHDNPEADAWLRRARFDGRTSGIAPKDDNFTQIGWHCYMNPSTAAQGILKLHSLPRHNSPLPNDDYPDLSKMDIFK
jgi:dTDP-4-amino-4,6-dideoxygalactose transaminase